MTQENKELLFKDLSARLPYRVKGFAEHGVFKGIVTLRNINIDNDCQPIACYNNYSSLHVKVSEFKPYLFPLSSMTEEQRKEEYKLMNSNFYTSTVELPDFYNKNHIDYRGLIPMGLAIDATGLGIYGK